MSKRDAFLEAACREKVEDFLHFIQLHKDKAEPFDVEEVVQEMPRNQRLTLWGKLGSLLQDVLQELPPERWAQGGEEGMEVESATHVMAVVDGVTLVADVSIKVLEDGDAYNALLEIIHRLHNVLVSLPVSEAPLQLHIHTLCEAWWKKGLKEKEQFGRTAFLISLQKSFTLKKPVSNCPRVWSLHDVLLSLDYTSEENKQIIDLLLQCFHRPNYIRNDDGKRFLVFLFSWNVDFIIIIHGTIKNQLEFYNKTMTTHIMEIYFRAWKKASGDFLEKIESSCIQDFMQNAIFLPRASPVHAKVRQIVSYFHSRKGCNKLDKMLCNLYKPILWKALSVPNFEVRANATLLFTEAFPVHDPEQNNKNIDEAIQKQLDTSLLDDPHPTVRCNAILGVCKILSKCWELLPPTIVTDFLKKLVMELASDSSSPDVRCSVFKCLTIVLDNSLSHPLLERLLPTLKYSLHDNSEKVRIVFLDMLIKVKAVRAAKFWDVCNMDHLLARLAIDSHPVSKRVVDLLFKSFFPVNEAEREWCSRCITLIQMNPMAARKFYQHVHRHTAPTNIIKMMLAIRRAVNSCIQTDCDVSEINDGNKENSEVRHMAVVSSLLEIVVILWRSVEKALKLNKEAQKYTFAKFGNVMSKYFQDERCTVPLIQLASRLSHPAPSCGVLSRLRRMDSGAVPTQYGQLLDCMCSWGLAADILELITDWLTEALPKQGDNTKRKVRIQETVEAKPDLALAYLEYLFSHTLAREKVLALGPQPLKQLHTVLGNWRSVLYAHFSSSAEDPKGPGVETALKVFMHHGRLGAHLQHSSSEGRHYLLSLEDVAAWVAERVLPFLAKRTNEDEEEDEEEEKFQSLAAQITEVSSIITNVNIKLRKANLHVEKRPPKALIEPKEICVGSSQAQEDATTVVLGVVANIFQKIIELLARRLKKEPEEGERLCQSAVPSLAGFLQVAQAWDKAPLSGVFSTLFAVVVVEKRHLLQKITHPEEVITPESVEDMPPLSSILLSVILKSSSLTRAFLTEVSSSFDSEAISSLNELAAVLHVLAVIFGIRAVKTNLCIPFCYRVIYESSVKTLNEILDL
uniref:Non-SMC condensin II complex, subunit G2 n=1 Tax=Cyclopterus lumpus TaxID=8103 RepID=A0A8C3AZ80_CYCLU